MAVWAVWAVVAAWAMRPALGGADRIMPPPPPPMAPVPPAVQGLTDGDDHLLLGALGATFLTATVVCAVLASRRKPLPDGD